MQAEVRSVATQQLVYVGAQCLAIAASIANCLRYAYKLPMARVYIQALLAAIVLIADLAVFVVVTLGLIAFQLHLVVGGESEQWSTSMNSFRSMSIEFLTGAAAYHDCVFTKLLPVEGML